MKRRADRPANAPVNVDLSLVVRALMHLYALLGSLKRFARINKAQRVSLSDRHELACGHLSYDSDCDCVSDTEMRISYYNDSIGYSDYPECHSLDSYEYPGSDEGGYTRIHVGILFRTAYALNLLFLYRLDLARVFCPYILERLDVDAVTTVINSFRCNSFDVYRTYTRNCKNVIHMIDALVRVHRIIYPPDCHVLGSSICRIISDYVVSFHPPSSSGVTICNCNLLPHAQAVVGLYDRPCCVTDLVCFSHFCRDYVDESQLGVVYEYSKTVEHFGV
jgi:hypothetical protein